MKKTMSFIAIALMTLPAVAGDVWRIFPLIEGLSAVEEISEVPTDPAERKQLVESCVQKLLVSNPFFENSCAAVKGIIASNGNLTSSLLASHLSCRVDCVTPAESVGTCSLETMWIEGKPDKKFLALKDPTDTIFPLSEAPSTGGPGQVIFLNDFNAAEIRAKLIEKAKSCAGWAMRCFPEMICP